MAKLRRSAGRPSPVKKAKAAAPAARTKAKPAVKKSASKPAKPAKKKPAAPKPASRPAKPAGKAVKPAARPAIPPAAKAAPVKGKPKAPAPPPRRSTYADAVLLYERGLHSLQAKRYREAADTLKRVIAEFPEEIELHERAQLYIRVCERQLAPLDATPKTPEEQVYAATLAMNSGGVDRAISLLNTALQQHPNNEDAEYMLGVALATKGDAQGAFQHLARALELNPDFRDAIRKETELEGLRETAEFQTLLAAAAAAPRREKRAKPGTKR
jgi:tetratricopeptide (TPR) repeat protein